MTNSYQTVNILNTAYMHLSFFLLNNYCLLYNKLKLEMSCKNVLANILIINTYKSFSYMY